MSDLILAESLLLLALDDDKGTDTTNWGSDPGLAGALLLDLVRGGHVAEDGKRLVARPDVPAHPTLRAAHEVIATDEKERKTADWISRLPSKLKPVKDRVAGPLVERGVLDEQRRKRLGLFETVRFPAADPEPERALRAGLRAVLVDEEDATEEQAMLVALLEATDLVAQAVDKPDRAVAKRRAKVVAERTPSSDAVKAAMDGIQAAVIVSLMAATTVTTTTT